MKESLTFPERKWRKQVIEWNEMVSGAGVQPQKPDLYPPFWMKVWMGRRLLKLRLSFETSENRVRLQIVCFVWPTVQNPRTSGLLSQARKPSQLRSWNHWLFSIFGRKKGFYQIGFSAQVKILEGLFTCPDKMNTSCHHNVSPQTSSYPGNGNGRPGTCSSSPPPRRAEQDKSGPLILWYSQTSTHFNICVLKVEVCCFTVRCVCAVFAEFSFTCMVGLINALEQDRFISGFMGFYLKMVGASPSLWGYTSWRWSAFYVYISFHHVSSGWASSEHRLCCDDVILGRCHSLCPLPHYHPPHVQRVSCGVIPCLPCSLNEPS